MQLKALCFYLTALLPLFFANSVQAGPVALARREGLSEKRGM